MTVYGVLVPRDPPGKSTSPSRWFSRALGLERGCDERRSESTDPTTAIRGRVIKTQSLHLHRDHHIPRRGDDKIELAGAEGWRDFIADTITEFVESLSGKPPKLEKRARRLEQPKRTKRNPRRQHHAESLGHLVP